MNDFNEFWSLFPRRVSKRKALESWKREVKRTPPEYIIAGLRRQLPYFASKSLEHVPYPATWLNQARWEDEVQQPQRNQGRRTIADAAAEFISADHRSDAFGLPLLSWH